MPHKQYSKRFIVEIIGLNKLPLFNNSPEGNHIFFKFSKNVCSVNEIANFIACTRKLALLIGNNLFVHAGIVPEIAKKYDIDKINDIITLYLLNRLNHPENFYDVILDPKNSPLWNRIFGNRKYDEKKCQELLHPLKKLLPINYLRNTNNIDIN